MIGKTCPICKKGKLKFVGIEFVEGIMHRKYECKECGIIQFIPTNIFLGSSELKLYN